MIQLPVNFLQSTGCITHLASGKSSLKNNLSSDNKIRSVTWVQLIILCYVTHSRFIAVRRYLIELSCASLTCALHLHGVWIKTGSSKLRQSETNRETTDRQNHKWKVHWETERHSANPASLSTPEALSCSASLTHQSRASKWGEVAFIMPSLSCQSLINCNLWKANKLSSYHTKE